MIPYITYTALILTGCTIFYKLFLQRETFFKANRFFLIACLLFSFVLPLIKVPQQFSFRKTETERLIDNPLAENNFSKPDHKVIGKPIVAFSPTQKHLITFSDIKKWIIWLYWFGIIAFAFNFFIQLASLIYQIYSKPVIKDGRYRIVEITGNKAPCSFGNNIFINPEKYDWDTYNQILLHEKIHVRQKHTIDLVLAEIVLVFQWFNPFAWEYRKAVENNLEFLTDNSLIKDAAVEKENYQISLLKVCAPQFPLSLTTNYNQSLLKKRIFMMNTKQSNLSTAWKYFFIVPMMVLFVSVFNDTAANAQSSEQKESKQSINKGLSTEGSWFATIKDDKIHIDFKSDESEYSTNSTTFPLSDFKDIPRDKQGNFSLTREAGTMNFTGKFEGNQGMGQYKFSPNKDFASFLKTEGIDETTDRDLMAYFLVNVKQSYVQMLKQNGYTKLDRNDLLPLAALDVNEDYIKSIKNAGFPGIDIRNLISFRALHVDAAYINEIRKAGYSDVSAQKIISFKAQRIDAKYIADIKNSVTFETSDDNADQKKQSNDNGHANEKIKDNNQKIKDNSVMKSDSDLGDISAFKALNISVDYINSIKAAGYPDVTSRDLVGMKANNVTADYINSIKSEGFADVSAHNIIGAKATGVDAALIKEYKNLGLEPLSLNNIIAAKSTGTTPAFITSMKEKGHDMKSINKYIMLKTAITEN